MLPLQETLALVTWYHAGAHPEALARAFGRDRRTIRATLRQAGVVLRCPEPPLRRGPTPLSSGTRQALRAYLQQQAVHVQGVYAQLAEAAQAQTPTGYVLHPGHYAQLVHEARPALPLVALATQLGLDLNQVLLAYADWADALDLGEAPPCSPQRGGRLACSG